MRYIVPKKKSGMTDKRIEKKKNIVRTQTRGAVLVPICQGDIALYDRDDIAPVPY